MTIKEARHKAGLSQKAMSKLLLIPERTIASWEVGERQAPKYVENLVIEKLLQIAEDNND